MKRKAQIQESDYMRAQHTYMQELNAIIAERTPQNGREIQQRIEALMRRAYPGFYQNEPQQISTAQEQAAPQEPMQSAQDSAEPLRQTLTAGQFITGLAYFIARPIIRPILNSCK